MSSTKEEKLPKLPAYCLPSFWLTMSLMLVATVLSFTDLLHFDKKRLESARRSEELRHYYRDTVMTLKRAQIDNLKEIKDRLIVLELAMRKSEIEESKPKEDPKPVVESPLAKAAVKLESMSDEEYQSMVLEHVKASDRQLIDQHFKQENAFKASLNPAEKQKFDAEVKRECAKLLANSKVEGELSDLQKQAFRRSAESMVIVDWRAKDSVAQQDNRWKRYIERKREENRRWNEEFTAELAERLGPEFLDQMVEDDE